ncbi:hypothetical protein [Heyndrickxia ginsengihumi]|uniref:hypothetical protein n=1 Tax=Heyndrickxia ginsengihumi TaxID=363870 RepID=UPI003D20E21D
MQKQETLHMDGRKNRTIVTFISKQVNVRRMYITHSLELDGYSSMGIYWHKGTTYCYYVKKEDL